MKRYFAYIRVSTAKQGERGSSLQEQRSAIELFANRHNLDLVAWFEERETAAKEGRRKFARMLAELKRGRADGVIIHKIDRSARNLRDWARIGDLIDQGIDIQFVHDNLDLQSRGGRLSADIQAVVAADYIRNLRDEVRKGFYGRLKQGLYPLPAPTGYLDRGKGQPKLHDPVMAPLVRQAFELYATNRYSLFALQDEMARRGLRSRRGKVMTFSALGKMLHNSFYLGLIHIERTNEVFRGIHAPLVTKALFDQVQDVLAGKCNNKTIKHEFIFRRLIRCAACRYHLAGERKKGKYVYYRCFNPACRGAVIREEDVDQHYERLLRLVALRPEEIGDLRDLAAEQIATGKSDVEARKHTLQMALGKCEERLARTTDAFVDGVIEKADYEQRKYQLLRDRQGILDSLADKQNHRSAAETVLNYLELQDVPQFLYGLANPAEKRDIVENVTWNFEVRGKSPAITLKSPYQEIVNWRLSAVGGPCRSTLGTRRRQLFDILVAVAEQANDPHRAANDNWPPWRFRKRA